MIEDFSGGLIEEEVEFWRNYVGEAGSSSIGAVVDGLGSAFSNGSMMAWIS